MRNRGRPGTEFIGVVEQTRGSETSQYPMEKKSNEIPSVAASEGGRAQTVLREKDGVVGLPMSASDCETNRLGTAGHRG